MPQTQNSSDSLIQLGLSSDSVYLGMTGWALITDNDAPKLYQALQTLFKNS